MTYEMYRYVFLEAGFACGVFLAISVVLFFAMHIPKIISDLTGRTARKAIQKIRMQNERSGDKSFRSSAVNLERGKLTDKISRSGRLIPRNATPFGTGVVTEKIATQQLSAEGPAGVTTVLTALGDTEKLDAGSEETTALNPAGQEFTIEYEITFIHTSDVIA